MQPARMASHVGAFNASRNVRPASPELARAYDRIIALKKLALRDTELGDVRALNSTFTSLEYLATTHFAGDLSRVQIGADAECAGELELCMEEQIFVRAVANAREACNLAMLEIVLSQATTFELIKSISATFHEAPMVPVIMTTCARLLRAREGVAANYADRVCWAQIFVNLALIGDFGACTSLAEFLSKSGMRRIGLIEFRSARRARLTYVQRRFFAILLLYGIDVTAEIVNDEDPCANRTLLMERIKTASMWIAYEMF